MWLTCTLFCILGAPELSVTLTVSLSLSDMVPSSCTQWYKRTRGLILSCQCCMKDTDVTRSCYCLQSFDHYTGPEFNIWFHDGMSEYFEIYTEASASCVVSTRYPNVMLSSCALGQLEVVFFFSGWHISSVFLDN